MQASPSSFDAVVVGTGVAGLASALALARRGVHVALLGPKPPLPTPAPDTYDPRVYAISPASRDFLLGLGAWSAIPEARIAPVTAMAVSGDGATVHLDAGQASMADLAAVVEGQELERALRNALQVFGVAWTQARFAGLTRRAGSHGIELFTDERQILSTALVVAADGAASPVRQAAGLSAQRRDYDAIGLVVHLDAELPHRGVARQWFTPRGVLALLPMPDTQGARPQVSMVWSMRRSEADTLLALPAEEANARLGLLLAEATGQQLGALTPRSRLLGFPLALLTAPRVAAPGVALVGDAAHVVHPLAGQGLNLGLGDAHALAEAVGAREPFRGPGDERVLRRYQRARAEAVTAMRLATDGLYHLYDAPLGPLRRAGMDLVERLPFAKRLLIRRASQF
ncbi:FAD-binding protein [Verticiella sediminum]|uniref:FAD-binding protein n=1 Tax=Verticiella sediminum TaxID=1247510 RepID=A0A556AJ22_9BURK|nr:FAD-dependent monooxygenase [Verticiella sediminum]TSH92883.1 FAD-binding protein [Verticiella sediminum]